MKEFLQWKKPEGLTRRQSAELDLDITERFYHDYLHDRTSEFAVGGVSVISNPLHVSFLPLLPSW